MRGGRSAAAQISPVISNVAATVNPSVVPSAAQKFGVASSHPRAIEMPPASATSAASSAIITTQ